MTTSDSALSPEQQLSLAPNLLLADRKVNRYPNPFFDLSQQYMPPTIKELFRWCTFYFYNSPLIGAAIKKMTRYPITDLIIEDHQESVRALWDTVFNKHLKIKSRLIEANQDRGVYGNCLVSVHLPFTRMLKCRKCGENAPINQWEWRFGGSYNFLGKCHKCNEEGELDAKDVPYKDIKKVRILRWNPENFEIKYNEYTGNKIYLYTVPRRLRMAIQAGDKDIVQDTPLIVLKAIKDMKKIRMNTDNFFHLSNPTLAEQDQGWGKPIIIHVLKDMFYFYTLRRAQEAIALEHIVPFDIIYPMPNAQMDPYVHSDLSSWRTQLKIIIDQHRRDPNFKAIIPIPVGFGRLGGDGKALLLGPELQYLTQTIVGGMGIPQEFLFGNLSWCLTKKSHIFSSSGLVTLDEICPNEIGFEKLSEDVYVDTKEGKQKIALVHTTEPKPVVSIKSKMGLKLSGSPIHKVWVLEKDMSMSWKCLKDISVGEYIAVSRKSDIWGTGILSKELCRLLGYIMSDGSLSDICMTFANTDAQVFDDFLFCFEKIFGYVPKYKWRKPEEIPGHFGTKDCAWTKITDKIVLDYLYKLDMKHYSADHYIPLIIRSSTKECVCEFLKALFEGDGFCPVSTEKQSITYTSISDKLLEQIQLLLLNMGIVSHKYPAYEDRIPSLQIISVYAAEYMNQIGFISERKTNAFNELIVRDGFRCDANKYPYLLDNLKALKEKTNGCGAWIKDNKERVLDKETYTTKELAQLINRDTSSITLYIRKGQIKGTAEVRTDGRFSTFIFTKEEVARFLKEKGTSKRAAVGQTTWEINTNNIDYINWEGIKELDPVLYERIQELIKTDFIWDQIPEKTETIEKEEMCDLTIYETHSYVANGFISHNTGSSVSLRTLENDFIQARTDLLDLVNWIKDKIRIWMSYPDVANMRFADFRMADDIQRNQQLIGLNAQRKVSDQTLLTELGYDYEAEQKKLISEAFVQNYLLDVMAKGQARSQGESNIISFNFQQRLERLAQQAQLEAQQKIEGALSHDNSGQIGMMVQKLLKMDPIKADVAISQLKEQVPEVGVAVEQAYQSIAETQKEQMQQQAQAQQQMQQQASDATFQGLIAAQNQQMMNQVSGQPGQPGQKGQPGGAKKNPAQKQQGGVNMSPAPNKQPPRRQGGV